MLMLLRVIWQGPRLKELVEGGLEAELEAEEGEKPMLAI